MGLLPMYFQTNDNDPDKILVLLKMNLLYTFLLTIKL